MSGKLLRGVGLALIAMPEPITTPIGLGILGVSWAISRHEQSQKRAYLKHIIGEYLHTYRPFGYGMGSVTKTSADLPYRSQKEPLFHIDGAYPAAARVAGNPVLRSGVASPSVVHHTFDPGRVSKQFDAGGAKRGFEGYWGPQPRLDIATIRNSLKMVPSLS